MSHFPSIEAEKQTVSLGEGVDLHYFDLNSTGTFTILLLHGLGVCAESWGFQFSQLIESNFRVLAPDLRGFGRSSFHSGSINIKILADDMAHLLDILQIDSCHVAGISMGGTVGLQFTLDYPEQVDSLILVNTFARLRPQRISSWMFYTIRFLLVNILGIQSQARFVAKKLFPGPEQQQYRDIFCSQISQANTNAYRSMMRSLITFDISGRLKELNVPILVITGDRDTIVPPETQYKLVQAIPTSIHEVIHDASHAVIVEKPDEVNHLMQNFLLQFV